ncbi:MAG TPA: NACHT domain-containing protein, partial [Bacteroidales bacterium]|nr:NACHT domain-containing protein [Bacteroidales bacterium]
MQKRPSERGADRCKSSNCAESALAPNYWIVGSKSYKKYVEVFKEKIKVDDFSRRLGIGIAKIDKLIGSTIVPTLLEKIEDKDGDIAYKRRKADSILNIPNNTFIFGQPGCGKSTLFKTLSKEIIEQNSLRNDTEFYPILFSFSSLKDNNYDIYKAIDSYFKQEQYKSLEIDSDKLLKNNQCVLFIDALDEIPSNSDKETAFNSIKEFCHENPKLRLICTSRPSDFINEQCSANGFTTLEFDDINRKEVEQFIGSYFSDNILKSKRLLKSLKDTGIMDRLPNTPLTVALITIIFDEREVEIPSTITDLYSMFTDLLLGKTIVSDTIEIIETNIKQRVLSHLAKELHFSNRISIEYGEAKLFIDAYLKSRGQEKIDTEELINDLVSNTGLLFYNDKCELQFKHLSFQEFFTAYELFHHRQADRNMFIDNFNKLWWQNIALFYAGFSKDAPKLLQEIIDKSIPKTFEEKINNIAGIGRLLQALYNTPIDVRKNGLKATTQNSVDAINFLVNTEDTKYDFWKRFSKYAIYQIFAGWFHFNHHSITLLEPFNQEFDELFQLHGNLKKEEEIFELEYKLFLLSSIPASSSFLDYKNYRKLIENTKSKDLSFLALTEMHFREDYKLMPKEQQLKDDIQKIYKKLKSKFAAIREKTPISKIVNKSIAET